MFLMSELSQNEDEMFTKVMCTDLVKNRQGLYYTVI